ncbi:PspC domain-containing protein [Shewanella sp.]|uniref:PspC domain-containing protein n=1 Tax=Shewanella sp. TaxID=50422 RepID=UPI003565AAB2
MSSIEMRLKNPRRMVCGVAAAMADKFDWSCMWTRVAWMVFTLLNPAMTLLVYFALALLMEKWDA